MLLFLAVLALGVLGTGMPAGLAAQGEAPETVAMRYLESMRQRDWNAIAWLTHHDAMAELRSLLEPLFTSRLPEADDFRQQLLGIRTVTEAQALSDTTMFINFLRSMSARMPAVEDVMRSATIAPIGHLVRGDTAYVVYRSTTRVEGMPVSTLAVFALRRDGEAWRGLLTGDFSSLATALRQALGG